MKTKEQLQKERKQQEWLRQNGVDEYCLYVTDFKGVIIWKFLTQLRDQYGKNIYWVQNQFKLYYGKLQKIDDSFLQKHLLRWLSDCMGVPLGNYKGHLPTLAHINEHLEGQSEFHAGWKKSTKNIGEYCEHCKFYEGFRDVFVRWKNKRGQTEKQIIRGKCDCEMGGKLNESSYIDIIARWEAMHPESYITYSQWSYRENRLMSAVEQSSERMDKRVELGYMGKDEDSYYPIWNAPFWRTTFGLAAAELENLGMPPKLKEEIEKEIEHRSAIKSYNFKDKLRKRSNKDGDQDIPVSIQKIMGYDV